MSPLIHISSDPKICRAIISQHTKIVAFRAPRIIHPFKGEREIRARLCDFSEIARGNQVKN
jgi:hypothetical protein